MIVEKGKINLGILKQATDKLQQAIYSNTENNLITLYIEPTVSSKRHHIKIYASLEYISYPILDEFSHQEPLVPLEKLNLIEEFIASFFKIILDNNNSQIYLKTVIILPNKKANNQKLHIFELLNTLDWYRLIWKAKRLTSALNYNSSSLNTVEIGVQGSDTLSLRDALKLTTKHASELLEPYIQLYKDNSPSRSLSVQGLGGIDLCILLKLYCSRKNFLSYYDKSEAEFLCNFLLSDKNKVRLEEKYSAIDKQLPNTLLSTLTGDDAEHIDDLNLNPFDTQNLISINTEYLINWAKTERLDVLTAKKVIPLILQDTFNNSDYARNAIEISALLYNNSEGEVKGIISQRIYKTLTAEELTYWLLKSDQRKLELAIDLINSKQTDIRFFAIGIIFQAGLAEVLPYINSVATAEIIFNIFHENPSDWLRVSNNSDVNAVLLQLSFLEFR